MAIEDILKALHDQAQADCDAIIADANEHANLILEDAKREAAKIHENYAHQVERVAKAGAAKMVNSARLEAKMEVSSAKGEGVASVFSSAREKLTSLRSVGYDRLFDALADEALRGASGEVAIHLAEADVERANRAVAAKGMSVVVTGDLDTAGGLVVESDGGRVILRNTLEDRLERVGTIVQADVAKVLF